MRTLPPSWRRRLRAALVPLAVATAVACPAVLGVSALLSIHTAPRVHHEVGRVPPRSIAIVPGARVYADGTPSPTLEDRLEAARGLYVAGRVRRILVSGDHSRPDYDEVTAMQRWLVAHDVPASAILMDHAGLRTLDTMVRAAEVFGVRDAVVCTQAFHLPRSLFLADSAGIDAVGLVADRRAYASSRIDAARELFASTRAVLDRYVFHTRPRVPGPA